MCSCLITWDPVYYMCSCLLHVFLLIACKVSCFITCCLLRVLLFITCAPVYYMCSCLLHMLLFITRAQYNMCSCLLHLLLFITCAPVYYTCSCYLQLMVDGVYGDPGVVAPARVVLGCIPAPDNVTTQYHNMEGRDVGEGPRSLAHVQWNSVQVSTDTVFDDSG